MFLHLPLIMDTLHGMNSMNSMSNQILSFSSPQYNVHGVWTVVLTWSAILPEFYSAIVAVNRDIILLQIFLSVLCTSCICWYYHNYFCAKFFMLLVCLCKPWLDVTKWRIAPYSPSPIVCQSVFGWTEKFETFVHAIFCTNAVSIILCISKNYSS